jgi:hypothetical protein
MERTQLAREICNRAHLTGDLKLRSGLVASEYFDKYRFESNPRLLRAIAERTGDPKLKLPLPSRVLLAQSRLATTRLSSFSASPRGMPPVP